uniref:Uncharacterized protein n=1 Tax=Triticum urartu TaxID=4572 RepID=A0A8R7TU71_TRIUA
SLSLSRHTLTHEAGKRSAPSLLLPSLGTAPGATLYCYVYTAYIIRNAGVGVLSLRRDLNLVNRRVLLAQSRPLISTAVLPSHQATPWHLSSREPAREITTTTSSTASLLYCTFWCVFSL